MSMIDKLFRRETKEPKFGYAIGNFAIPPGWTLQRYLMAYGQIGWLYGCVSRIAASVADAQWHLYMVRNGERKEIDKHPLVAMLKYVNPFQTGQELFELSQMYLDLVGECFWVLNRNRLGIPAEIWIAPPERMAVVPSKEKFIQGYIYQFGGERVPLEVEEVIHIMYPNPANPYRGIGPAQSIAVDLDSEAYSGQWNRNFFYNDASPGLVIEHPGTVDPDEAERVKAKWEQEHRGVGKAHKIHILSEGAKISRYQISQKDMDFWRLRKVNREVILGAYGIPASIMGIEGPGSRARAEADAYIFAKYVVKPRLTRFREKLNEQLCILFGKDLELDFDDPVPENREQLVLEVDSGIKAGYLTINEARGKMGLDPVKNGDVFIIPMAVIPTPAQALGQPNGGELQEGIRLLPAKAVFATESEKETHWRTYVLKTEEQEKPFKALLKRLFDDQADEVVGCLTGADKPDDALFDEDEAIDTFKDAFKPLIEGVFRDAAEGAMKQEFPLDEAALEWLKARSLELAKMVNGTTREHLRRVLAEGFQEGESIPKLTKRIREFYHNGYEHRAPIVARTETIAASNEGALWRYESEDVEKVEFFCAMDERSFTGCACPDLHGNEYTPKEAHGMIPVHPQCRCVWLPVE